MSCSTEPPRCSPTSGSKVERSRSPSGPFRFRVPTRHDVACGHDLGAAFFDLDRTLLAERPERCSAGRCARPARHPQHPRRELLFNLFNTIGETIPSMALAARPSPSPRALAGQRAACGEAVASQLVERVQPFAAGLFAEHRAAGRPVVLATTTPYDLVKPFADLLGLDDVVATGTASTPTALRRNARRSVRVERRQALRRARVGRAP